MQDISRINDEIRMRARWSNPTLARRIAAFTFLSIGLNLTAWAANVGVLLFNVFGTDMGFLKAIIIFFIVWFVIWAWTRFILNPMGRRLALQMHEEVLKVISGICDRAGQKKT